MTGYLIHVYTHYIIYTPTHTHGSHIYSSSVGSTPENADRFMIFGFCASVIPPGNHSFSFAIFDVRNGNVFQWSLQPKSKIRFATRAVYPYFDSRRTGVFRSEAFLEAAIDCRYSSFRFLFPPPVMLLIHARCTFLEYEETPVVKSERGRAIFPKRDSSKLMIPERR